jgi:DNA/RNA-binding domain of Phe-tRNA-synthetase-like protein
MIKIAQNWQISHPGAALGILTMRKVANQGKSSSLEDQRTNLENLLRERYQGMTRKDLLQLPEIAAYSTYYKRFKKTYHLLLQLESITLKNRHLSKGIPLVQAMFMAELNNLLLTAGHDLDQIQGSITLDSASGEETYTLISGEQATCKPGDMVTFDSQGVFCSVIYGQDLRTRITNKTQNVLYVVYVPPGIRQEVIETHLQELEGNVILAFPEATITWREIYHAHPLGGVQSTD